MTGENHTLQSASGWSGHTTPRRDETYSRKAVAMPRKPSHYAALWGLHAVVEFLVIEHSQNDHSRAFVDKVSPLHLASRWGHEEVVRMLLAVSAAQIRKPRTNTDRHHWILGRDGDTRKTLVCSSGTMRMRTSRTIWTKSQIPAWCWIV